MDGDESFQDLLYRRSLRYMAVFKEVGDYAIRACRLVLRKRLLKFTRGNDLFDLLPQSGACGSCRASEIHSCFPGVPIAFATADLRVLLSES